MFLTFYKTLKNISFIGIALFLPSIGCAQTINDFIKESAPIESTIQGCYSHLSYYELTDEQRDRIDVNSSKINNLLLRFAKSHTLKAYEETSELYALELIRLNQTRPSITCDEALITNLTNRTNQVIQRFSGIKSPRER